MPDIDAKMMGLVPLALLLVQVLRTAITGLDARPKLLPLVSIAVGIALAECYAAAYPPAGLGLGARLAYEAFVGLVIGLSASGLYSPAATASRAIGLTKE